MIKEIIVLFILMMSAASAEIYIESLENERYNIGDVAVLEGYVQQQNKFNGDLEIRYLCGNESKVMLFSVINLDAGEKHPFSQEFPVNKVIDGNCYFTVSVNGGDVSEERRSGDFVLTNELRVEGDLDVLTQKPGNDVIVSGVIRKMNGLRVVSGSVALTLNGKVYGSGLSDGAFSYRVTLPEDISAGEQAILIKARDLEGNEGSGEVRFRVVSVPEELVVNIDKDTYRPGERITTTVFLNDQSGKNVLGSSTVQLVDPNGDDTLTKVVENGIEFEIFLDEITLPGTWILRGENKGFETSKKFYVEEVKDKIVRLEGDKLIIRNIGNVDYDEPVEISLEGDDGEEFKIIKDTLLKPNQTIIVDLNHEAPGGNYDVSVGGNLITGNVILEGSGIENLKKNYTAGYFALVFVFLFLIFIVVSKGRKRLSSRKVARDRGEKILYKEDDSVSRAVMRNREIQKSREAREMKEKRSDFMRASKEDVEHMLNRIKKEVPVDSSERKDRGNPFNIFD